MKLYTEEQVKEMLNKINSVLPKRASLLVYMVENITEYMTPIELPSDEEIQVIALNMISNLKDKLESREEAFYLGGFQTCINWMKEQILNQNK